MDPTSPPASDMESDQTDAPSQQSEAEDRMDTDDYPEGDQESHLWGYLQPCHTTDGIRIDCWKIPALYVHQRGITHRDLKPENILLTSGKFPTVKITDFGLSKVATKSSLLLSIVGTPIYLAPEILNESESPDPMGYDNRVDIFSIGGIVHLCLTKTDPFSTLKEANMVARVRGRVRNMKALQDANVTANAMNFIERLLEENPMERPSISQVFAHSWLARHKPRGGVPRIRNMGLEDTDESTARENDDTDSSSRSTTTRSMARKQKKEKIRTANAKRKVRIMAPSRANSSSTSFEIDILPATPRRRKEAKVVVNTPTRRSTRSSAKKMA